MLLFSPLLPPLLHHYSLPLSPHVTACRTKQRGCLGAPRGSQESSGIFVHSIFLLCLSLMFRLSSPPPPLLFLAPPSFRFILSSLSSSLLFAPILTFLSSTVPDFPSRVSYTSDLPPPRIAQQEMEKPKGWDSSQWSKEDFQNVRILM